MVRAILLSTLVIACGIFAADAQATCPNPPQAQRQRQLCQDQSSRSACTANPTCCYDPLVTPNCYVNPNADISARVAAAKQKINSFGIKPPADISPVVAEARKLGAQVDASVATKIEGRALNFPLATLLIDFPTCPVETPFCHRTPCGAELGDAEVNPITCYSDPRCCFDKALYIHKAIFGPGYMGGAPVCYNGPTSRTYLSIASQIKPWNPFFQQIVVDVFETVLDTFFDLQQTPLCRITNALNFPLFRNPKCGWDGITKVQCSLKGCCYNSNDNECVYPRTDLPYSYSGFDLYPELNTDRIEETQCASIADFSFNPNIYRRLPCKCPTGTDTAATVLINCPQGRCCPNYLALIPELADLTAATSGVAPTFSSLLPFFAGGGLSGVGFSQFYCPYFYVPIPGLDPLFASVESCCKQHACYHKKRLVASWGPWSRCSSPCGPGTSSRSRVCPSFQSCPTIPADTRPCDSGPCAQWAPWSGYSGCSATCGTTGYQSRSRRCSFGSSCPGQGFQQIPCNRFTCASWGAWQQWSTCSRPCGSLGLRSRERFCFANSQQSSNCPGPSRQTNQCNRFSCGIWGQWSYTSDCSGSCGTSGSRNRVRQCLQNGQAVGTGCPGSRTGVISCQNPQCTWGGWGSWGTCTQSCTRLRSRICSGGGQCLPPTPTQSEPCIDGSCPQDPVSDVINWGLWSGWSTCSAQCNGQRSRIRRCLYNGQTNSIVQNQACVCLHSSSFLDQEQCSNQGQCGATWTAWSVWSGCSRTCGTIGSRSRQRSCRIGTQNVAATNCPGIDQTTQGCNRVPCPTQSTTNWTPWGSWGPCPKTCRPSTDTFAPQRIRVRCPGAFDENCTHDRIDIQKQDCNNFVCQ